MADKTLNKQEVAKYLLKLRKASESFEGFVRLIYPDWTLPSFQLELINTLDQLERDDLGCDNVLITMPPRFAKSTFSTVLFPTYFMARNPNRYLMSCSYNAELAKDFGRQIRSVIEQPSIAQAFPDLNLSQESRAADTWRTESGGAYFAVGVGGTTSGRPANCFAADTPVHTETGIKPISEINPGDSVLSYNHSQEHFEYKRVLATRNKRSTTKTYSAAGAVFRATQDHPVFSEGKYRTLDEVTHGQLPVQSLRHSLPGETEPAQEVLFEGMLPISKSHNAGVSDLPQHLRDQGVRSLQEAQDSQVLLSRMRGEQLCPQRGGALRELQESRSSQASLCERSQGLQQEMRGRISPRRSPEAQAPDMPSVCKTLQSEDDVSTVLLQGLREQGAQQACVEGKQSEVSSWGGVLPVSGGLVSHISENPRKGRASVHYLQETRRKHGRPSHRHGQEQQRAGEPNQSLQKLPHASPQDAWLVPASCTEVAEGRYETVYDLQVEDNENFVASNILVHNCLILDDPLKSREDAESVTQRNKSWNYYVSALSTRLQPQPDGTKPKQIVVLTRWHPDDIAGRLMATEDWAEGRWKHINFKAIQTVKKHKRSRRNLPKDDPRYIDDPAVYKNLPSTVRDVHVEEEASLWPERIPLEDLKRRQRLNPREFASLYQQEPYIEGGNLIRTEWWQYYPSDLRPQSFQSLIITIDTAFKKNEQSDYSVACVAGLDRSGDIYIVDVIRGKYEFPELKQRLIRLNNTWRGRGLRALYVEDKASGQSLIQSLKRESGMAVIPYKVDKDKVSRVNAILPIIEGGRVLIPEEAPWLDAFIDEMVTFPNGTHDDQVDATAMAIDILSRTGLTPDEVSLHVNPMQSLNNQAPNFGKSLFKTLSGRARSWKGWGQ